MNKNFDYYRVLGNKQAYFVDGIMERIDAEKHRHYHSLENHIENLFFESETKEEALLALYHDLVYDPKSKTNEEDSASEWLKDSLRFYNPGDEEIDLIYKAILDTKHHSNPSSELSEKFIRRDLAGFEQPFHLILEDYKLIRKEYEFYDWTLFKEGRIKILEHFRDNNKFISEEAKIKIGFQIEYLKQEKIKIAVYPGSFNPLHLGHLNVIEKAEKIFDKVIILITQNPDKEANSFNIPEALKYKQVEFCTGGIIPWIQSKNYPITLIRGLRNTSDFSAEQNYSKWLTEIDSSTRIVNIFCDKEFEHISSRDIRALNSLHPEVANKYIVK